jgi:hypothetical protein
MNIKNNKASLLLTVGVSLALIWGSSYLMTMGYVSLPVQIAMGQNYNTTAASEFPPTASSTTQQTNSSIILGNPIFTEQDKATPPVPMVINGTQGLQVSYSGSGVVKGVNFSANGTVFIVPSDKSADLRGHAVITTADGEKGTYNFYSIGHENANGTTADSGAAFFHTTSSGKLGIVSDLVVIFKDQTDKEGNGTTVGWEWR